MSTIKISIDINGELDQAVNKMPEVNWSVVCNDAVREAIFQYCIKREYKFDEEISKVGDNESLIKTNLHPKFSSKRLLEEFVSKILKIKGFSLEHNHPTYYGIRHYSQKGLVGVIYPQKRICRMKIYYRQFNGNIKKLIIKDFKIEKPLGWRDTMSGTFFVTELDEIDNVVEIFKKLVSN